MPAKGEFALVLACAAWPPSPARNLAVSRSAAGAIDWPRLLRIARRHRIEGLVHDGLKRAEIGLPPEIAAELREASAAIARDNLAFAAESIRLQGLLEEAGTQFLFVKGVTLGVLAYGTLGVKHAWDIDLLVAPEDVLATAELLTGAGYRRIRPDPDLSPEQFRIWNALSKESTWRNDRTGLHVEIHHALVDNPHFLAGVSLSSPRQAVRIGSGAMLATLSTDHLFSYLCAHGASHAWSRLKWLADIAALLKEMTPAEISHLHARALELGAGRSAASALILCSELLGLALPPELEAQLYRDRAALWLARIGLNRMLTGNGETELHSTALGTVPLHLSYFLFLPGWRYKLQELRRKLLSPADRSTIRLPRGLRFLYPLMLMPRWLAYRVRLARR